MCTPSITTAPIVFLLLYAMGLHIALGAMMTPAEPAKRFWNKHGERELFMNLSNNTKVSNVWFRAWMIQVIRMHSHPEESEILQRNAQLAQANYVMTAAQEAIRA